MCNIRQRVIVSHKFSLYESLSYNSILSQFVCFFATTVPHFIRRTNTQHFCSPDTLPTCVHMAYLLLTSLLNPRPTALSHKYNPFMCLKPTTHTPDANPLQHNLITGTFLFPPQSTSWDSVLNHHTAVGALVFSSFEHLVVGHVVLVRRDLAHHEEQTGGQGAHYDEQRDDQA